MRFVHISDLHIGKKLKERSLEEDQRHILGQILSIIDDVSPDAVLIAGDVYDTSSPTIESVRMLDWFLTELSTRDLDTFMIAGNHDSADKLGFGSRIFEKNRLFISGVFSGTMDRHRVVRGEEVVDVYLLPFIKPINVRRFHPDEDVESYEDAVRIAIAGTEISDGVPKVLVTHQFIVSGSHGPDLSESESSFVGGTESVDCSVFDGFDYVALGHIHGPQRIGRDTVRYCGTPLKYSLSEKDHAKSVTVVDICPGHVTVDTVPLTPLRDLRQIRGPLEELIEAGKDDPDSDDFIYVQLEGDSMDAMARLREVYPNVMSLEVVGRDHVFEQVSDVDIERVDLVELFGEFFENRVGRPMTEKQKQIVRELMDDGEGIL